MPNTSFLRPAGILCSGSAYNDKKNPYEKLKQFLYEENTGRTDVVFFASAASGYEHDQWVAEFGFDSYQCTGGLIDGFAHAVLQGNPAANRPARKLYGTPVKFGYEAHTIPNFDAWNNATWFNPNTTGVGNFLCGTATAYDSYYYYRPTTGTATSANSNTGYAKISMPNPGTNTFYQFHPDLGAYSLPWNSLWYSAFNGGLDLDNDSSLTPNSNQQLKVNQVLSKAIFFGAENDSNRNNLLSTTVPWSSNVTQTPEQPQRFWNLDHPWYSPNRLTNTFDIGIGYIDTTTGLVSEIFTDASTYGYVPAGITVGTSKATVLANSSLKSCYLDGVDFKNSANNDLINTIMWGGGKNTIIPAQDFYSYYSNELNGKELIVRTITVADIVSIRSLNMKATPPTSLSEFKQYDGFYTGDSAFFRWAWANTDTLGVPNQTYLNARVFKKWGLATSSDTSVSSKQLGLPYIFMWGLRSALPTIGAWQLFDWGTPRTIQISAYPLPNQLLGFPRSLSTLAPFGFFMLTQEDTPKMIAANTTIQKDRGLVIRPNLGFFHSGFDVTGRVPASEELNTATKDNILGIFKSADFKYCVTAYTLDKFSDEPTFEGANIVVTGHMRDIDSPVFSTIQAATNVVLPQTTRNKVADDSRLFTRTLVETTFNLNAVNADWSKGEFRFGFLGRGSAINTKGNLLITTHYGVDPSATNGISFSHADLSFRYRSGDIAYQNKIMDNGFGRTGVWLELFRSIAERQTKASLGGTPGISKKLVLMFETGIWEMANPNVSYNGYNTWSYFIDLPGGALSTLATGRAVFSGFENNVLNYVINAALLAGFTREEIVISFYTPTGITRTNVHSESVLDGLTLATLADDTSFITNINQRGNFIRAAEIFKNNILPGQGYFNPAPVGALTYSATNPPAQKVSHICMGSIPTISAKLNDIANDNKVNWYPQFGLEGQTYFTGFSSNGSLAVGSLLADYLNTTVSSTVFVPGWIKPIAELRNVQNDPVLNIDISLLVASPNSADIAPYFSDLKDLANAGNNLAKEFFSAITHKILQ